jgi:hypothetical protein
LPQPGIPHIPFATAAVIATGTTEMGGFDEIGTTDVVAGAADVVTGAAVVAGADDITEAEFVLAGELGDVLAGVASEIGADAEALLFSEAKVSGFGISMEQGFSPISVDDPCAAKVAMLGKSMGGFKKVSRENSAGSPACGL